MGLGRPAEAGRDQEGLSKQSGKELQNSSGQWRSATFKAVNRELGKAVTWSGRGAGSPGQGVIVGCRT